MIRSIERARFAQPEHLTRPPPQSVLFGSYPHNNSLEIAHRNAQELQHKPHLLGFFAHSARPFTTNPELLTQINQTIEAGILPVVSWGMRFDEFDLEVLAAELSQINGPFLWRPWFEMQGDWARGKNSWYGQFTDQEFIDQWRTMRDKFRQLVPNAKFVFSPNTTEVANSFEGLFPGEQWVDIVSLDGYNKQTNDWLSRGHYQFPDLSPELQFGPDIATLQRIAPATPLIISELNALDDPEFVAEAIAFAARAGAKAWMIFEWDKEGANWDEKNWSLRQNPAVAELVRAELANDYYVVEKGEGVLAVQQILLSLMEGSRFEHSQ